MEAITAARVSRTQRTSIHEIAARVAKLDLSVLHGKLVRDNGWSDEHLAIAEDLYRKFLTLSATFPDELFAPNQVIDRFWHTHILDTRKYAADCHTIVGRFIHHYPYLGLLGDLDKLNLTFEATKKRFNSEFGIVLADGHGAMTCGCQCGC